MQYVVSNQQMKEAERRCNESGTSYYQMMENAGTRCAEFILGTIPVSADILVMCGAGNNGGDGLVITRLLRQNGRNAAVLLVSTELEEIVSLSDTVAVMFDGALSRPLQGDELNVENLGLLLGGAKIEGGAAHA